MCLLGPFVSAYALTRHLRDACLGPIWLGRSLNVQTASCRFYSEAGVRSNSSVIQSTHHQANLEREKERKGSRESERDREKERKRKRERERKNVCVRERKCVWE